MNLIGKVALITGGRRIGAVVAEEFARRGADIAFVYRTSKAEAEAAVEVVRGLGTRAVTLQADLAVPEACQTVVADTVAALGRLDVLVNMASVYRSTAFDDLTAAGGMNLSYRVCRDVLGTDGEGTVDGSHPTDLGMMRYADALEPDLRTLLT